MGEILTDLTLVIVKIDSLKLLNQQINEMEDKICICGHGESVHATGRKGGATCCIDCMNEGISNNNSSECEGFTEKL